MNAPAVEILWWAECPSSDDALALLRERVAAAGMDPEGVVITEITSEEQAAQLGFPGSPTIRVNGADVQPPGDNQIGLSCRVYRSREGRVSAVPDAVDIDEALAGARA